MRIKFAHWHWYGHIVSGLAMPAIILDFFGPDWWTSKISFIVFGTVFILIGVPCTLFWTRIVKVEFVFSENDKRLMSYRLWKFYCEMSDRSLSNGSKKLDSGK